MIKCYPYFSLALLGVLSRLLDNTSKQKAGLGLPASVSSSKVSGDSDHKEAMVQGSESGRLTGSGFVWGQGNPMALRALMEALDALEDGGEEGQAAFPAQEEAAGEVGATVEERDALLDALSSVRSEAGVTVME